MGYFASLVVASTIQRYPLLDWIRLILALEVVAGHYIYPVHFPAVASFLSISGFLVSESLGRIGPGWEFAKRRLLRVIPAFLVSLGMTGIVFGGDEVLRTLFYYFSFGFASTDSGHAIAINRALWSLPFEEVAYAGLALLSCLKFNRVMPIFLAVGAVLCTYGAFCDRSGDQQIYRTLPLLWALAVGASMAGRTELVHKFRNWGPPLFAVALVIGTAFNLECIASLFAAPAVLLIGIGYRPGIGFKLPDLSYGIYIYHMPIFTACLLKGVSLCFACVFTTIAACASWFLIESQALSLRKIGLPSKANS